MGTWDYIADGQMSFFDTAQVPTSKAKNEPPRMVHCLFEQSGTFKNEFKKMGIPAEDYDIKNDFGQTDHVIDLFEEIVEGYDGKKSIFDDIQKDDLIMAFFPCIRFENQIMLSFRGQQAGIKSWTYPQKMRNCMRLQNELTEMYMVVNKLFILCMERGLRLIVENPYSQEHYLRRYWCLEPSVIDHDRRTRGDYFKKPTQFWSVNMEPSNNIIFETSGNNGLCKDASRYMNSAQYRSTGAKDKKTARSMIHPEYANRFIREFIL